MMVYMGVCDGIHGCYTACERLKVDLGYVILYLGVREYGPGCMDSVYGCM